MAKSNSSLCSGYSVWRGKLGLELSRARLAAAQRDLARGDTRVTRWVDSRAGNQPSRSFQNHEEGLLLPSPGFRNLNSARHKIVS